ncbi:MAG: PorV/PorQ family protein [bacterium]
MTIALALCLLAADPTGTATLPLLKIGQGPRAAALGEAFTGLADDASAIYWNPAGLALGGDYRLGLSHHQWFAGITDEVLHGALPVGPGRVGAALVYSGEPGIEYWDEANRPGEVFRTWHGAVSLGYGLALGERLAAGAALKGIYSDLFEAAGSGAALDLGALAALRPDLSVGLSARHLGLLSYGRAEPLPGEVAAGASWRGHGLTAVLDLVVPFDNPPAVRAGLEYAPLPELALRAGYRTGPASLTGLGPLAGLTAGLGVSVRGFGFDYALAPYGELGLVHRVGLNLALEKPAPPADGGIALAVLDARTRLPVRAGLALSGPLDTTLTADALRRDRLAPGRLVVRATASGYLPASDSFAIVAGRETRAELLLQPLRYGDIAGGIYDAGTKEPIGGTIVYRGPAAGDQRVGAADGRFRIRRLLVGEYRLGISGPSEDYVPQAAAIRVEPDSTVPADFYLVRKRQTIVLEGVNFETGKADIRPEFTAVLDSAGTILARTPGLRVELAGHTDPREINTREFPSNWKLSQARAEAVRRYLVEKFAIEPARLTAVGYADTQPIADNSTAAGMAKNRRTEFRILEDQ